MCKFLCGQKFSIHLGKCQGTRWLDHQMLNLKRKKKNRGYLTPSSVLTDHVFLPETTTMRMGSASLTGESPVRVSLGTGPFMWTPFRCRGRLKTESQVGAQPFVLRREHTRSCLSPRWCVFSPACVFCWLWPWTVSPCALPPARESQRPFSEAVAITTTVYPKMFPFVFEN